MHARLPETQPHLCIICWQDYEEAMNESWLLWGLVFGSIGFGFFSYGRKQRAVVPFICGLTLMIFPYFISSTLLLVGIGITLIIVPYFVKA
jgi:predicted membrane protein